MADEKKTIKPDSRPAAVQASKTDDIVDRWFNDSFHDRGIHTGTFNMLLEAKEDLKKRLNKLNKEV